MAVYVDDMKASLGRMVMCHMVADSIDELHEMAEKLGVRKWYQSQAKYPHYDICKSKRTKAMNFGAIEVSQRELLSIAKKLKQETNDE